jgi:hypothetical protein
VCCSEEVRRGRPAGVSSSRSSINDDDDDDDTTCTIMTYCRSSSKWHQRPVGMEGIAAGRGGCQRREADRWFWSMVVRSAVGVVCCVGVGSSEWRI